MKKNEVPDNEYRNIILTYIVKNGIDTGISGTYPGYLINELDNTIEKFLKYDEENRRLNND